MTHRSKVERERNEKLKATQRKGTLSARSTPRDMQRKRHVVSLYCDMHQQYLVGPAIIRLDRLKYFTVMTLLQPAVFYSSCTAASSYRPDCNKRHAARPRASDWSHILRILGTEEPAPSGDHSFHPLTLPLYFICSPSL